MIIFLLRTLKPAQNHSRPLLMGRSGSRWLRRWGIALALVILMTVGVGVQSIRANPSPTPASTSSPTGSLEELQQQQRKIETERSNIDLERDRLQQREQSAQQKLGYARSSVKATAAEIQANENRLQQENQRLKRLEQALNQAEANYQTQQRATVARLRFLQRQQGSYGLAVLLQSKNLNDFLDRRYQLQRIYGADRKLLAQFKSQTDSIVQQRQAVDAQKNEISLLTQQLWIQKLDFEQEAKSQQELINRLRLDRKALEAAETQLAKDSDTITVMIQQRLGVVNPGIQWRKGRGVLSYPSDGALTSGFGYRIHPILGYNKFHAGLDFGDDYGTPIRAAAQGKVLFAGWYGGFGQTVIIDHGNNVTTLYAHASDLYVTEGQKVQRGTSIASVGSTGFSTGPHLHFEVRVAGEPVDPLDYL